jgi:hypothetical protein
MFVPDEVFMKNVQNIQHVLDIKMVTFYKMTVVTSLSFLFYFFHLNAHHTADDTATCWLMMMSTLQ